MPSQGAAGLILVFILLLSAALDGEAPSCFSSTRFEK
jgi:hypothetical protein